MRPVLCLPVAALSVLVACVVAPGETTSSDEVVGVNRIAANRIAANRIAANRIAANRIAANRIAANRLRVNLLTTRELLSTDDGRAVFSLIVSCALPDTITLVATVDGTDFEFFGEIGLAPQWLDTRLNPHGQRWVSACMFARVNDRTLAIPISMRGPNRELAADAEERALWTLEEGAFYGNLFGPLDEPIQWFACRGRDLAAGATGELVNRDCAKPDPANPGRTLCDFVFAGDCGNFASDQACEAFSRNGTFYRVCHTSPIRRHHHHDGHRDGDRDRDGDGDRDDEDDVFEQVITTFVTP
jgi:hypothetical protein